MTTYKIKFAIEKQGEEQTVQEFTVFIHQYMRFLEQIRKLKGVR